VLKSLGTGIIIFIVLLLAAVVGTDGEWLIKYSSWVGGGCLILAMIFSNSIPWGMAPGSHMRGSETAEDRDRRISWSSYMLLAALPNLVGAIAVYIYTHH